MIRLLHLIIQRVAKESKANESNGGIRYFFDLFISKICISQVIRLNCLYCFDLVCDSVSLQFLQLRNVFTEFDFLDDELDKESEDMSSFGWTSTTELGKGESLDNLRNMPSPSRSGSEEELREIISKDEEMSDEEESEVLFTLIYLQI